MSDLIRDAISIRTYKAGEALAANRFVKLDSTAGQVVYADDNEAGIGITREAAASGADIEVVEEGTWPVESSANACTLGSVVCADADGKVRTITAGAQGTAQYYMGRARTARGATGQLVSVKLAPQYVPNPAPAG